MAQDQFLHGIEMVSVDDGPRPITSVRSSVIGVVGTAPDADPDMFPLDTPVLIAGKRTEAARLDMKRSGAGTLPGAIDGIFGQVGATIVVVRVPDGAKLETTKASVIGGVDPDTGKYTGCHALLAAESDVHVTPKILIAPGFTQEKSVVDAMVPLAERMRAMVYADGPNTTDVAAKTFRKNFGSKRVQVFEPWVRVFDPVIKDEVIRPASAHFAGLRARVDNALGWWWSMSNQEINGVAGLTRAIDFNMGDKNSRANLLNEQQITTIVRDDGYRAWGNRTCSSDQKWAFEVTVRTADMIEESIFRAHRWAVDRNITRTYFEDVSESVNAYLRYLTRIGAILGGSCWVDREANTRDSIKQGKAIFDFDFTGNFPGEHVTFRSHLVDTYIKDIFE